MLQIVWKNETEALTMVETNLFRQNVITLPLNVNTFMALTKNLRQSSTL